MAYPLSYAAPGWGFCPAPSASLRSPYSTVDRRGYVKTSNIVLCIRATERRPAGASNPTLPLTLALDRVALTSGQAYALGCPGRGTPMMVSVSPDFFEVSSIHRFGKSSFFEDAFVDPSRVGTLVFVRSDFVSILKPVQPMDHQRPGPHQAGDHQAQTPAEIAPHSA